MPFQVPQSFGPCFFDALRAQVFNDGDSECRRRQRRFPQVEELGANLEQLDRRFGVREIAVIVLAYNQRVPGDALGFREPESDLPISQETLFIDLC